MLALVECLLCIVFAELIYVIGGLLTTFNSGVEGVSPFIVILKDNFAILGGRIIYGFMPATAVALLLCSMLRFRLHWAAIGVVNIAVLLSVCVLWENQFFLLHRLIFIGFPLYKNFMHLLLVSCFFSPLILLKIGLWGNVLRSINKPVSLTQG